MLVAPPPPPPFAPPPPPPPPAVTFPVGAEVGRNETVGSKDGAEEGSMEGGTVGAGVVGTGVGAGLGCGEGRGGRDLFFSSPYSSIVFPSSYHTLAASAHVVSGKRPSRLSAHHPSLWSLV